jgi:cyclohexanone monooxygenase
MTPRTLDVLIIGAGFAGLCMLQKARSLGLSAHVAEASGGIGGTWYHNRYPGARCDVPSMEYSIQFSEELQQDWEWSERFAAQSELMDYVEHVADRFGLRDSISLSTRIRSARFNERSRRWLVCAETGESWDAQFLVAASGPLSTPNIPGWKGIERFEGPILHTGRWPHKPVDLKGKRVGVVGTGSSAVQVITALQPEVAELTVFQRTATYVVPLRNRPLDPDYVARIKADYAGFRARNSSMRGGYGSETPAGTVSALAVGHEERNAVFERRWEMGGLTFLGAFSDLVTNLEANWHAAEFVRGKIRTIVKDPETARLLSPSHPIGCKRMCLSDTYYDMFNRANVRLLDISGTGIEEVMEGGVVAGGRETRLDALVLATGFDAITGALKSIDITGRGGETIARKWQDGPRAYLGLMSAGFPNLFTIVGPGGASPLGNVLVLIEHHVGWIGDCLAHLAESGKSQIEADRRAEDAWVAELLETAGRTIYLSCNSWYLGSNVEGKPRAFMPYSGGLPAYSNRCAAIARNGYEGFVLS